VAEALRGYGRSERDRGEERWAEQRQTSLVMHVDPLFTVKAIRGSCSTAEFPPLTFTSHCDQAHVTRP
jgi:hypothetical protein